MAINRRLDSDMDFDEMIEKQKKVRIFRDNQMIDSSSIVVRYDGETIVTSSGVGDIAYHNRKDCEFFELKKR